MAFSSGNKSGPMSEINVTPLVDVMLVLLIIFIVTAPILTYPITVDLPQNVDTPPPTTQPPPPVSLRIDASNQIFWNNQPINIDTLDSRMAEMVSKDPTNQPQLQINADPQSEYEVVAKVLATAKNNSVQNIGFLQTN